MPTRAQAETVLVGVAPDAGAGLVGGLLARIGYDATGESPVAALSDAIVEGLLFCDVTVDDVSAPDDDDMARLASTDWPKFRDIAELRLLEIAAGGAGATGTVGAVKSISWEDYKKEYASATAEASGILTTKRTHARNRWGYGCGTITAGSIDYGFAQTDSTQTDPLWP